MLTRIPDKISKITKLTYIDLTYKDLTLNYYTIFYHLLST